MLSSTHSFKKKQKMKWGKKGVRPYSEDNYLLLHSEL